MLYPLPFGHPNPTRFFPIYRLQLNEVQTIIVKDIKQENLEDAKDGIYRNCLVCGDNNKKCGWFIIATTKIN
jgi:hypothetical protein